MYNLKHRKKLFTIIVLLVTNTISKHVTTQTNTTKTIELSFSDDEYTVKYSDINQTIETPHSEKKQTTETPHSSPRANSVRQVCDIDIYVDHSFYAGACRNSISCVVDTVTRTVSGADRHFRVVDFNSDGIADNVGVSIARLAVNTGGSSSFSNTTSPHNLLLEMARFAVEKWPKGSCLGVLFIDRTMDDDIVGLAYTGTIKRRGRRRRRRNSVGGICKRAARVGRRSLRRYNTLFVSSRRNGFQLTQAALELTLTHELGHSFGSHHDDVTGQCASDDGRQLGSAYVMHASDMRTNRATSFRFSDCSRLQIAPILVDSNCIREVRPACGNYAVDRDEECDCGPDKHCLIVSVHLHVVIPPL